MEGDSNNILVTCVHALRKGQTEAQLAGSITRGWDQLAQVVSPVAGMATCTTSNALAAAARPGFVMSSLDIALAACKSVAQPLP